jgi:hypothetical protein
MLSGYLGRSSTFDDAIGAFAISYGLQTVRDHAALLEALRSGRLPEAETGA